MCVETKLQDHGTRVKNTRLPLDLAEFVDDMANTIKYHNKAHVIAVAVQLLKDKHEGKILISKAT